jgi:Ran-binding protein 9/10
MDGDRNGEGQNGAGLRPWAAPRGSPLSFSRAYDLFMGGSVGENSRSGSNGGFFVPSYLRGSTYIQKLEEAHRARMAAQRESQQSHGGNGLAASSSSNSLHVKPASHRGMTYDVIEKPPPFSEGDDAMPQLPSRWNREDMYGGLEVLADGLEVKYTAPRGSGERDHEACAIRADHHMPVQCGIYYYEVTILSGKRDE